MVRRMNTQTHQAVPRERARLRTGAPARLLREGTTRRPGCAAVPTSDSVAFDHTARLVARSVAGDASAWDELVDRFSPLVWGIARAHRLSDSDAEDAFQATWLLLLENIHRLTQPERLAGWLATVARREALHTAQRNVRTLPVDDDHFALSTEEDDESLASVLTLERDAGVRRALATLPARDQTLLTLLVAEPPYSYQQIAQALGVPIGSIGPTRARCLQRLRSAMLATGMEAAV
jgi:RNA polymerase sigma factor (sigma-70 family)